MNSSIGYSNMSCEQIIAYNISTAKSFSLIYFLLIDQFPVPATRGHLGYPCTPPGVSSPRIFPLTSTHPQRDSSLQALGTVQYSTYGPGAVYGPCGLRSTVFPPMK